MARNQDGHKPDRPNGRVDDCIVFGSNDRRRLLWAIIRILSEKSDGGADWNDVLDEAEKRGIDRFWAHEEIKRRLRWEDAHLFNGNLHPHYERRCHADLWYSVMRSESENMALTALNTCLDNKGAIQRSLWRILSQRSGRRGARIDEVMDTAEQYGMDPLWVHEMLVFWDGRDNLTLSQSDNRAELEREEQPS
jgi:hypothetical protein